MLSGGGLPVSPDRNKNRSQRFTPALTEHYAVLISVTFCNSMADRWPGETGGSDQLPS